MAEIASLVVNVAGNISGAVNSFKSLEQTSRDASKKIENNFSNLKGVLGGIIGASFIKSIVDTGVQMDSIRQSFRAITGSAEGVADVMKFIQTTSARTGVNVLEASKDFRMLLGSVQGTGTSMQTVKDMFGAVSDASLVLGLRTDDVTGVMRAFGQIMSKGTVQAEELKGQIGDRLPGALSIASEAMGMTNKELLKMMENGSLISKEFLPKFADQLKKTYSDLVPIMQSTPKFAIDQFNNAFINLKDSIAQSGLLQIVTDVANSLSNGINSISKSSISEFGDIFYGIGNAVSLASDLIKGLLETLRSMGVTISDVVVAFVSYKVAVKAVEIATKAYTIATTTATTATVTFSTALRGIVFPIALAGVFTMAITSLAQASDEATKSYKRMVSVMTSEEIGSEVEKTKQYIDGLKQEIRNLYGINYDKLTPDEIGSSKFLKNVTKDVKFAEEKLKLLETRNSDIIKANEKQQEIIKKQEEDQKSYKQQTVLDIIDNARLKSLKDGQKEYETLLKEYKRSKQQVIETFGANSAEASQFENYWKSIFDENSKKRAKEAKDELSVFQKALIELDAQFKSMKGLTEFDKEWETFKGKINKKDSQVSAEEWNKISDAFRKAFDAKVVRELNDSLEDLKFDGISKTLSETDKLIVEATKHFNELGAKSPEAFAKLDEIIKQIKANAKEIQNIDFVNNYGNVSARWMQRLQELQRQYGELSQEQQDIIFEKEKRNFEADDKNFKDRLEKVNTWGEAYSAWYDNFQAKNETWGQQIVSVFDVATSSMESAMTDFLDITSDNFADFGKMAKSILQDIYREIVRVSVVKPLVSSLMGSFAWNGGIATGTGFQRFASGYIAGGGYSSYDSLSNDTIPALISKGEAVIPASVVNSNRGLVKALISSRGQKFANGYVEGGANGATGTTKVEIINQSGQQMEVTSVSQRMDSEGAILSVVINALRTNKMGLRTMVKQS